MERGNGGVDGRCVCCEMSGCFVNCIQSKSKRTVRGRKVLWLRFNAWLRLHVFPILCTESFDT